MQYHFMCIIPVQKGHFLIADIFSLSELSYEAKKTPACSIVFIEYARQERAHQQIMNTKLWPEQTRGNIARCIFHLKTGQLIFFYSQ